MIHLGSTVRWACAPAAGTIAFIAFAAAITAAVLVAPATKLRGQALEIGRGYAAEDWPFVGGNWSSSRYSTLTDISTETIDRLGGAWVTRLDGGASSRATPVVRDGVIYLTAGANVFAIDARSGEPFWRWRADDAEAGMVPSWQGVGLGEELVFVGLRSADVIGLRQDTGELEWVTPVGSVPRQQGEIVTTAPLHAHGRIFVGVANGDAGEQGRIVALDAATGEKLWTFFIVPRPGDFGHETWPQDTSAWTLGGGGVWLNGTADPDLGMVYFSTGNPVPMFGGEVRKGDNLFTASVVALDVETGERRWHYQVVRHDVWDADIATPVLLYETEVDGHPLKALAAIRADGYLFLFDRETGEPLLPIEERPVPQDAFQYTAPTQPFPAGLDSILPDCSFWRDRVPPPFELSCSSYTPPSRTEHTIVAPGAPIPMVRVTPMSFSPQTGYIYAQGRATVGLARRFNDPYLLFSTGYHPTFPEPVGILAAVDTRTGAVAWKREFSAGRLATSGPLTTAGGLMFWGSADGLFEAFDAQTGERVWTFRTSPGGARLRPGPAATYELDGTQRITVPMANELWTFMLDGTVPPRTGGPSDPSETPHSWYGPVAAPRETDVIETGRLAEIPESIPGGKRSELDEHAFNPVRALITVGARVQFLNNGEIPHTVAARDGSWTTGTLEPGQSEHVTFDQPGTFLYHCKDHRWAIGEVTVEAGESLWGQTAESGRGYPAQDWPFVGGDWSSSRYSTLTDISTETIDRLGGAWVTRLEGGASSRATPVVKEGVIYLTAGANVFAIDAKSGNTVWRWQPDDAEARMVPSWQGVGLGEEFVFVGFRNADVAALRQDTGELVWVTPVGSVPQQEGEIVTTAPLHAHGRIFVGVANGDAGGQGRIVALDAASGEKLWTFFIVPRPGEFGHDTWPQDTYAWTLGGGGVWLNGTVDPDLGMVYFSTGNPVPMFGGEIRKGDNLFTASAVALDVETGERRWHYQVVRHDVWDADIATPVLLYETEVDGQPRKALAAIRADGYLFLFDRETGEPLTPIEERPVPQDEFLHTAPTQPFPVGLESILPDCSYWRDRVPPPFELSCSVYTPPSRTKHTIVAPGAPIPIVRVTPMSFSPQTGYIYAQGRATVGRARRFDDPWNSHNGGYQPTLPDPVGILAAIDTRTGALAWKHEVPSWRLATSGPLTTAGGLVFWGAADGLFEAFDATTGANVWTFRTSPAGARLRPGPAATYQIDGQQFIAIPMGNELWTFSLDGPVAARPDEPSESPEIVENWFGPVAGPEETDQIETGTLAENPEWSLGGRRNALDEHQFHPVRALVSVGARVQFLNNGEIPHTVAARDGSWTTGSLQPGRWEHVVFDQPGTFLYHCTDHPWAIGEMMVEP